MEGMRSSLSSLSVVQGVPAEHEFVLPQTLPPNQSCWLLRQVPGKAVFSGEHLRGGDLREAEGLDPAPGADVQEEPGGDGLCAARSPAGH